MSGRIRVVDDRRQRRLIVGGAILSAYPLDGDWSTIEREYADRLDDFFSVLALQFANAGEWAKAREYLIKAGDQAVRIAADAEDAVVDAADRIGR